jgi:hypothetical protein
MSWAAFYRQIETVRPGSSSIKICASRRVSAPQRDPGPLRGLWAEGYLTTRTGGRAMRALQLCQRRKGKKKNIT